MVKVLFVCTGNTCRSPMAEMYFNAYCGSNRIAAEAKSAGLCACDGGKISVGAQTVLANFNIATGGFASRQFTPRLADASDLIVAMTSSHRARIAILAASAAGKTRLLLDFSPGKGGDVPDPFGGGAATYHAVFEIMRPALENLAESLRQTT